MSLFSSPPFAFAQGGFFYLTSFAFKLICLSGATVQGWTSGGYGFGRVRFFGIKSGLVPF